MPSNLLWSWMCPTWEEHCLPLALHISDKLYRTSKLKQTLNPTTNPMKSVPKWLFFLFHKTVNVLTSKPEPHQHTFLLPLFTLTPAKFGSTSNTVFASSLLQPSRHEKCSTLILWGSNQNREHFHFSAAGVILPNRNQNGHLSGHSFSKSHSDKSPRV